MNANPRGALSRPLTLEQAVSLAVRNNPALQAALQQPELSRAELRQESLPENPELAASFLAASRGESGLYPRLSASQNVLDLYLAGLRKKAAASRLERAQLQAGLDTLTLATETKKAFYELQAVSQFRDLLREIADSSRAGEELAGRQLEAGNINRLEHNAHRLIREQAEIELLRSEAEFRFARLRLAELLGLPDAEKSVRVAGRLRPVPGAAFSASRLEEAALANRLDVLANRREAAGLAQDYRLARWQALPRLNVGVEIEKDAEATLIGPEVGLEVPLFDRGQAKRQRAQAEISVNRREAAALEHRARSEVRAALARLTEARLLALRYRDRVIPLLDETLEEGSRHYNFMLKGVYDLLELKREQIRTRREYVHSVKDYWIARAELEQAVGGSLDAAKKKP